MSDELEKHYNKGLDILGDLYRSSSHENRSQLEQLSFQMSLMRNHVEQELGKVEQLDNVKQLIVEQLEYSLKLFIRRNKMGLVKTHWDDMTSVSLSILNKIVEIMPFSYYALKFFDIRRKVRYHIDGNSIIASGEIDDLVDLDKLRSQAYALTKSMFARDVLLTYEIDENELDEKPILRLVFDFSKHDKYIYAVKVDDKGTATLGLPVNFKSYKIDREKFNKMDKHHIIVVTKDFEVKKIHTSPDNLRAKLPQSEILHFPFLFRPLSLIIPREGEVVFAPEVVDEFNTGCMDAQKLDQQDHEGSFQKNLSEYFTYFDFFSLFTE